MVYKKINTAEQEIIALFLRASFESYTVYGIAKKINRYVSQVQKAINNLKQMKIVSVKKLGSKTNRCTINFSTADPDILTCASIYAKKRFLDKHLKIKLITDEIEKKLGRDLYIMLIFGSYAKGTAASKSDIDLCFIIQDKGNVDEFKSRLKRILGNFRYKIHINVFTVEWFYDMIKEKDTIGREILKESIVLHGHDLYYGLVRKYDQETGYSESSIAI